jgi:acylpyruvate hydrolase
MRFVVFERAGRRGLAVADGRGTLHGLLATEARYPGDLMTLIGAGPEALASAGRALEGGEGFAESAVTFLPPLGSPPKIICVGLNYLDHSKEGGFEQPAYPTIFARFRSSLIGQRETLIRPRVSEQFDYEGELVAVIGRPGRHIGRADALDHVIGYSIFNDASVRDYQLRTPQWTVGKNFDGTGAFGPWLVTADELPPGASGLKLTTRLQGQIVQSASTADLIFDVATLVSLLSEAFTLETGDVIVTGTPSGVGVARRPPLFMKDGDICEVEIEGIGRLVNPVADERG